MATTSNFKTALIAAFASLVTMAVPAAHAATWSDASLGLRYGNQFAEPGIAPKFAKAIVNFSYASGDRLGSNLFVGDLLVSDHNDPVNGGGSGAQEYYGFYQRNFSLAALTDRQGGYGLVKDILLVGRFDLETKDTAFAPRSRKIRLGASVSLPVPAGFWTVGLQALKQTDHNGISKQNVNFHVAPVLTSAWSIPVAGIGTFAGFIDVIGPKGKNGFGIETATEVVTRGTFMFDIGGAKSGMKAGFGLEYWKNKFGNPSSVVGSTHTTPLLLAEYHF